MKNDLSCAVVRDLLPAYAEGLTAPETNEAVGRHLAHCPECAAHLAAMRAPEAAEQEETDKEVDYLKTVRRRGRRRPPRSSGGARGPDPGSAAPARRWG